MSRPTPDSLFPYSSSEVAAVCGVSAPTIKHLVKGHVLKKRARGTGNWHAYDMEDALRIMLSKELFRVGLQVSGIHSLFEAIQQPIAPSAKPWSWLRTADARREGACLVLILTHRALSATTGAAYLTTLDGAKQWLGQRTAIAIDVNSLIRELEERTGRRYDDLGPLPREVSG